MQQCLSDCLEKLKGQTNQKKLILFYALMMFFLTIFVPEGWIIPDGVVQLSDYCFIWDIQERHDIDARLWVIQFIGLSVTFGLLYWYFDESPSKFSHQMELENLRADVRLRIAEINADTRIREAELMRED